MIIVTGGAGFIGSAFISKLNSEGISDIVVVDNLGSSEKWKNLGGRQILDYLHKDQLPDALASKSLEDTTHVIHMGACSSTTETNAEYMMQNNFLYTKSLASWALDKGVRFIYASSAATYGEGEFGFSDETEDIEKYRPLNVYALSKQLFDLWAKQTGASDSICGLKFFNVFGPNEYHKEDMSSVVFKAYHQILEKRSMGLFKSYREDYGDGEQKRDFVYVKDCCDALWWLMNNQVSGLYNIGTGVSRSWNDLARSVFSAMNVEESIHYIDMPEHLQGKYQYFTEAKVDKLRAAGFEQPFTTLEEAIKDYVENYLRHEKDSVLRHL